MPKSYRLVICAIAVAGSLTACGNDEPNKVDLTAYADSAPPVGEAVDYVVHTHCGVETLKVDGRWWRAVEPLYGANGPGSSPGGWGDPYQLGELTLTSDDRITFEAHGKKVDFVPSEDEPTSMCR